MTLVEFLLARIAEDERAIAVNGMSDARDCDLVPAADGIGVEMYPARALAECEAKRRIIDAYTGPNRFLDTVDGEFAVLPLLANAYVDHPDFQDEWRL